ncbi:MAG: mechanosensitive ion channel [Gammaproteobacteria bacterium]|nr:mechanosensitive ion channel [Gammaproteobacteria bacterium]
MSSFGARIYVPSRLETWQRFFLLTVLLFWFPPAGADTPVWEIPELTRDIVLDARQSVEKELAGIAKEPSEEESQRRSILKERGELLGDLQNSLERREWLANALDTLKKREKSILADLKRQEKAAPPAPPANPTPEEFARSREESERVTRELEELRAQAKTREELMRGLSENMLKAREQVKNTREEAERLRLLLAGETGADAKIPLQMQIDNQRIKEKAGQERLRLLDEEQQYEKETISIRDKQLELAALRREAAEGAYVLYREALNQRQEALLETKQQELAQKEAAARQAASQDARFLAEKEAQIARVQKNIADLNKLKTDLLGAISMWEKGLNREKAELKNLREMIAQSGLDKRAAVILKDAFARVKQRDEDHANAVLMELSTRLEAVRGRQYEINDRLLHQRDQWRAALKPVLDTLPQQRHADFERKADRVFDRYRESLRSEKQLLLAVAAEKRRLDLAPIEQREVLAELEAFVLSNIFWIQDDEPLGMESARRLGREIFSLSNPYSLVNWWLRVISRETAQRLAATVPQPRFVVAAALLLIALPWLLSLLRGHLRTLTRKSGETSDPPPPAAMSVSLLGAALGPVYFLAAAYLIGSMEFPAAIGAVVQRVLINMSLLWFLWRVIWLLLAPPNGFLPVHFGLDAEVAKSLRRTLNLMLSAYLVCLLPWLIFRAEPFLFSALPRLGYTLFEIAAVVVFYRLIRRRSLLMRSLLGDQNHGGSLLAANWDLISHLLLVFMAAIVVLDVAGFRFGAAYLAKNALFTFLTVILLTGLYHMLMAIVEPLIKKRRRVPAVLAPGEPTRETRRAVLAQIRGSLRLLLAVAGAVLLAFYWGLNESAFRVLSEYTLYSAAGPNGKLRFVTLADVSLFFISLGLTFWLVKHLPRLFELLFFSRVRLDDGLRYAIVTMSRYTVIVAGLLAAFSFLKLDLAKVGWLVAAISVGLGFGLQEIVANFVSGIILLMERPIRVGDVITVGTAFGEVTRINIRSTTVLSPEKQEFLIPNRDLITKEVINWTLGTSAVRVELPIGVAYGVDVDLVTELLLDIADKDPEVLKNPRPEALFVLHGASSLDFIMRVFVSHPTRHLPVFDRLNKAISKSFAAHNIEIPFAQQDINIRSGLFPESG